MNSYDNKKQKIHQIMKEIAKNDVALAFSGGVDSSLLLKLLVEHARNHGTKVYAITAHTELHPKADLVLAKELAAQMGAVHMVMEIHELKEADIENNPEDRCYRCKRYLFEEMLQQIKKQKVSTLIEGTNADDQKMYRPGFRAVKELGVRSPLLEAGFTKSEVRTLAREYEISVAQRPAAPCLATRFPYNTSLSLEELKKVEQGERYLKSFGLYNLRLRIHKDVARIEIDLEQLPILMSHKENIIEYLHGLGYEYITIDMEGFRSGSMDRKIEKEKSNIPK